MFSKSDESPLKGDTPLLINQGFINPGLTLNWQRNMLRRRRHCRAWYDATIPSAFKFKGAFSFCNWMPFGSGSASLAQACPRRSLFRVCRSQGEAREIQARALVGARPPAPLGFSWRVHCLVAGRRVGFCWVWHIWTRMPGSAVHV